MHLSPVEYVIKILAGGRVSAAAEMLGCDRSSIYRWKSPSERRGCDGNIPRRLQRRILDTAKARGLDLTADDLIYGRTISAGSTK